VLAAIVVPDEPDVVVTVPEPPVFSAIVVADPPSDCRVNKPEFGVIEILPPLLDNVPVLPLPASSVKAPDGEMTEMPLPDTELLIVFEPRSTIDEFKVKVLLDEPVANDILLPKLILLLPAVLSTTFAPAVNDPVPVTNKLDPEVASVSCKFNVPPACTVAPALFVTVTAPLVAPSVNALPLLVSIVPLLVNVPPFAFIVIALSDDTVTPVGTVVPDKPDVVVTVPEPPVLKSIVVVVGINPSGW
jgi:hypothetical protein